MQQELNYPKRLKNLLIKANLLGKGKVQLFCKQFMVNYVNQSLSTDEDVSTIQKPFDTSPGELAIFFKKDVNNYYINDWRIGLTKEEIELIRVECRVPEPNEYYEDIFIREGQVLDLEIPYQMFLYRAAQANPTLAANRALADSNAIFWFEDVENIESETKEKNEVFKRVAELVAKLDFIEKVKIMKIMNFEYNVFEAADIQNAKIVEERFTEFAQDYGRRVLILKAYDHPIKEQLNLLYEGFELGVLKKTGDSIFTIGGENLGDNKEAFAESMKSESTRNKLIASITKAKQAPSTVSKSDFLIVDSTVADYDLSYDTYDDLKYFPTEAMQKLLSKEGIAFEEMDPKEVLITKLKEFHSNKKKIANDNAGNLPSGTTTTTSAKNK